MLGVIPIQAKVEMTNYTNSHILTLHNGLGKITSSSTRIIHLIDVIQLQNALDRLANHIDTELRSSDLYHTLHFEIEQSKSIFHSLLYPNKTRHTRSINALGTAWKFVAGSPDHDNLVAIENNLNNHHHPKQ